MHIKIYKEITNTYGDDTPRYGGPEEIVKKDSYKNTKYLSIEDIILKVAKKTKQSINTIRNEYYDKVLEKHTQIINDNTYDYILKAVMAYVGYEEWNKDNMRETTINTNKLVQANIKNNEFILKIYFCKERYDQDYINEIKRYKNKGWSWLNLKKERENEIDLYNNILKIKNFKVQIYSPKGTITKGNVICQNIDIKPFKKHLKKLSPHYYYPLAFPKEPENVSKIIKYIKINKLNK